MKRKTSTGKGKVAMSATRRTVLISLCAGGTVLSFPNWLMRVAHGAPAPVRTRPEASTDQGKKMLELYRTGVGIMKDEKKFPSFHPHSWKFQAFTHQIPAGTNVNSIFKAGAGQSPADVAKYRKFALGRESEGHPGDDRIWATCLHEGDESFLPWHRLYLTYFEQIVETVTGQPFALPYWGYTDPAKRKLPDIFREPKIGSAVNPLYFDQRQKAFLQNGLTGISGLEKSRFQAIMRSANFRRTPRRDGFTDMLEGDIHDQIHGTIGTRLGMGNPLTAAQDPIFWLHHSAIDQIWESWRQPGANGASPKDPTDAAWRGRTWPFVDATVARRGDRGTEFALKAASNLKYRYDQLIEVQAVPVGAGPETAPGEPQVVQQGAPAAAKLNNSGDSVAVTLKPTVDPGVALGLNDNPSTRYQLVIRLRTTPQPGVYSVFLKPTPEAPEVPVGSFSLFSAGMAGPHAGHGSLVQSDVLRGIDVTTLVRAKTIDPINPGQVIVRAGNLEDPIDVTVTGAEIIAK